MFSWIHSVNIIDPKNQKAIAWQSKLLLLIDLLLLFIKIFPKVSHRIAFNWWRGEDINFRTPGSKVSFHPLELFI